MCIPLILTRFNNVRLNGKTVFYSINMSYSKVRKLLNCIHITTSVDPDETFNGVVD